MCDAENVITVRPKQKDYNAYVIFIFVIVITIPDKLPL